MHAKNSSSNYQNSFHGEIKIIFTIVKQRSE